MLNNVILIRGQSFSGNCYPNNYYLMATKAKVCFDQPHILSSNNICNFFYIAFLISIVQEKLRPPKLNHCPELFIALLYRAWHSDPNERPTLLLIKKILWLILNTLPKKKEEYSEETISELHNQWINEYNLSEKYLPSEPRITNEQSMNLYQEHLTIVERILAIEKDIRELKQKQAKHDHYEQLLDENEQLRKDIDTLRARLVH